MLCDGDIKPINPRRHFDRFHSDDYSKIFPGDFKRERARFGDSGTLLRTVLQD